MKTLPIAEALRLLRTRLKLTQVAAAGRVDGAPEYRTLSHWETDRKVPSLQLLADYLEALELDFHDLQDALDRVRDEPSPTSERLAGLAERVEGLAMTVGRLEARLQALEAGAQ